MIYMVPQMMGGGPCEHCGTNFMACSTGTSAGKMAVGVAMARKVIIKLFTYQCRQDAKFLGSQVDTVADDCNGWPACAVDRKSVV